MLEIKGRGSMGGRFPPRGCFTGPPPWLTRHHSLLLSSHSWQVCVLNSSQKDTRQVGSGPPLPSPCGCITSGMTLAPNRVIFPGPGCRVGTFVIGRATVELLRPHSCPGGCQEAFSPHLLGSNEVGGILRATGEQHLMNVTLPARLGLLLHSPVAHHVCCTHPVPTDSMSSLGVGQRPRELGVPLATFLFPMCVK